MDKNYRHCGLGRRLLVIAYDSCLLFSALFFATLAALGLGGGVAFAAGDPFYAAYLLLICWFYFVWQWKVGRQTLGMRAWHVWLVTREGAPAGWKNLSLRFILAGVSWLALGAGFLWGLVDKDRLTFHDRYSGTRLVYAGRI